VDVVAGELVLHPLTADEAERVLNRQLVPGEKWASEYPSVVQADFLAAYAIEARSPQHAWHWQSQVRRRSDGLVIGGAGVTGPADERGSVIIGYELVGELSDAVHGVEVVRALIEIAREMGARRVSTDVFEDDQVRRHVYFGAGLSEVSRDGRVVYLERAI
jgi:hypothetical protein